MCFHHSLDFSALCFFFFAPPTPLYQAIIKCSFLQELLRSARLDRFAASLAQFGVRDVKSLAASKHDDTFLKFNVGLDDPVDMLRFKQLRDRARGLSAPSTSSSSSVDDEAARSFEAHRRAEEAAFAAAREQKEHGRRGSASVAFAGASSGTGSVAGSRAGSVDAELKVRRLALSLSL